MGGLSSRLTLACRSLAQRPAGPTFPYVLSLSLGSVSSYACHTLCDKLAASTSFSAEQCHALQQSQRQMCLFLNDAQTERINTAFKVQRPSPLWNATGTLLEHY
jgi:hypothetical protein